MEFKALKALADVMLKLDARALEKARAAGEIIEVWEDDQES
jgi:hypothetical protein